MKKIIIFIIATILLVGCNSITQTSPEKHETGVVEESAQIINDYGDTMVNSIQDAKKITEQYNQNGKELEESIQKSKIN
ncbi:hypothetical protein EOM39_02495 [Candidatus Gracilibacteria bacterium]|nr:hypothetical protein [Candidatus Gracilibacteria bacterium]